MKKVSLLVLGFSISLSALAVPQMASESAMQCQQIRQQMKLNHQAIDVAYHKNDACTMGKLMIQNRQAFESHPTCFPKMEKMMKRMQQQNSGLPTTAK